MGNKIIHKISVATESGFTCQHCGYETVTFDGSTPAACAHCHTVNPVLAWKNKITNHVSAEVLPIK